LAKQKKTFKTKKGGFGIWIISMEVFKGERRNFAGLKLLGGGLNGPLRKVLRWAWKKLV